MACCSGKELAPRSRALGGKEGIIIPTHFHNFLPHIIEHSERWAPRFVPEVVSFILFSDAAAVLRCSHLCVFIAVFFFVVNENKDHADAAVHFELTVA